MLDAGAVEQLIGSFRIGVGRGHVGGFPEVQILSTAKLVLLRDVVAIQIFHVRVSVPPPIGL